MHVAPGGGTDRFTPRFLAATVGNLAFALPFMPQATTLHDSDLLGLPVIMAGLMLYRFSSKPEEVEDEQEDDACEDGSEERRRRDGTDARDVGVVEDGLREPLLQGDI